LCNRRRPSSAANDDACFSDDRRRGGRADKITFQLGFLPNGANGPFFVVAQQGLYAAENLEVTIVCLDKLDPMTVIDPGFGGS
jgi:ABC-type nitrate/sulfonate/bicarbonate transport system substrate-binding protein